MHVIKNLILNKVELVSGFGRVVKFTFGPSENQAQIDRAIELAGKISGVKKVLNEMSIKK